MSRLSLSSVQKVNVIIGDKWTPGLLCCLTNDSTLRFCQLQEKLSPINPRTLSARLTHLEQQGMITKSRCDNSQRYQYSLSTIGKSLIPIIERMSQWPQE